MSYSHHKHKSLDYDPCRTQLIWVLIVVIIIIVYLFSPRGEWGHWKHGGFASYMLQFNWKVQHVLSMINLSYHVCVNVNCHFESSCSLCNTNIKWAIIIRRRIWILIQNSKLVSGWTLLSWTQLPYVLFHVISLESLAQQGVQLL